MRRRSLALLAAVAILLHWAGVGHSQIVGQSQYKPGEPIVLTFAEAAPEGVKRTIQWSSSDGATVLAVEDGFKVHAWAVAGQHKVRARALDTIKVFMPDPAFPDDPSKAKPSEFSIPQPEWTFGLTVKAPIPLSVLAGGDVEKLAKIYRAMLGNLDKAPDTVSGFRVLHGTLIGQQGVADNPAVIEITRRMDEAFADLSGWTPEITAVATELLQRVIAELGAQPPPADPTVPTVPSQPTLATAATYVYEKDDTAPPAEVLVGINRLNRERKIRATVFEEDTVDGDGDVPEQYKVPLAAAKESGLPSLVVTAGNRVVNVVKDPRTEAAVVGAAP